ncbi:MAG: AMP-binding protein [Novosphingobium sp.]
MNQSYVKGADHPPLIDETVGQALVKAAHRFADGIALIVHDQGIEWTWAEFAHRVDALATGLLGLGLTKGDRLGVWSPNRSEWVLAQMATARIGVILVNINPAYRLAEVEYALNKVGCRAIIVAPAFKTSHYIEMLEQIGPARLPHLEFRISLGDDHWPGYLRFADVLKEPDAARIDAAAEGLQPTDPINVQFTSGTTGAPKGATLTHRNILNNGFFVGQAIRLTPVDRVCIPVPLYHCFGMTMGNLACLTNGATMVYPGEAFEPELVLKSVEAYRCTALYGVPTMFVATLDYPGLDQFDLTSLRTGIMAGAPCPEVVMQQVMERMNMTEVTIAYGMTETSPVSFQTGMTDPVWARLATVGRVQPHLEVKIVTADGATAPHGVPGEICTRGYSVMAGYWDDAERTAEAIDADGWMHTGDLGTIDEQAYCRITGRIKDMLIRGGENIYPREIEEFLTRLPFLSDVQVVGIPDERFGEEVCACIRLRPGHEASADSVRKACHGQIAHYKVPRYVLFVDEFPMTVTGKVQKHLLRDQAIALLGNAAAGAPEIHSSGAG